MSRELRGATTTWSSARRWTDVSQTESTLIVAEIGIGCALLIVVFLGAVAIGRRVALPIERARQRQLEFTADASHELRTPLSVIEAQATLALARGRDAAWDDAAFGRIDAELKRTRHLVDDMLWLARFDSTGGPAEAEPVDVMVLAAQTADRFGAVAEARKQTLTVDARLDPRRRNRDRRRRNGWTGWSACCWTTPASTPRRAAASPSASRPRGDASA